MESKAKTHQQKENNCKQTNKTDNRGKQSATLTKSSELSERSSLN